ncbi:MAG TPA: hypothetical protein VFN97_26810 [Actinospica sp.]|nr:hypothetical protein [Actinospica sp.]
MGSESAIGLPAETCSAAAERLAAAAPWARPALRAARRASTSVSLARVSRLLNRESRVEAASSALPLTRGGPGAGDEVVAALLEVGEPGSGIAWAPTTRRRPIR